MRDRRPAGFPARRTTGSSGRGTVRLLPAFDNYLIGYRDRGFIDDGRRGEVYVGGIIRPTVLLDGRVVGRWELQRGRSGALTVRTHPFTAWTAQTRAAVDAEVADIARFLGAPAAPATL